MQIAWGTEQLELQQQLRGYLAELITDDVRERFRVEGRGGQTYQAVRRRLGQDGWLGVSWPVEHGGRGLSPLEQCIFREEAERAGAPVPFITMDTVGPALIRFGTDEQRRRYLPPILRGESEFAIGYSEPAAGSDLAALTTRAVRDGDDYVINGSKIYTTHAQVADHVWLAARTGDEDARHRTLSIFIVPTDSPGFSVTELDTIVADVTTVTYYDNVRVPAANLMLGENEGWRLITSQLNSERAMIGGFAARTAALFDDVLDWLRRPQGPARPVDQPWIQAAMARAHALLEAVRLHNWRLASAAERGDLAAADASMVKVFASESVREATRLMLEVLGAGAMLAADSPGALLRGRLEHAYRAVMLYTFGGGTNEIQREIVAWHGLGMPRGRR
jgi:alkylation response protein AidB-like acyl-CoA dehydrogenase